jgi:hypothetical protein
MTEHRYSRPCFLAVATFLAGLTAGWMGELRAADAPPSPRVRALRIQRVGDTTYFHVRFEVPADMEGEMEGPNAQTFIRRPRLVPQDGKTHAVYHRFDTPAIPVRDQPLPQAEPPQRPVPGNRTTLSWLCNRKLTRRR